MKQALKFILTLSLVLVFAFGVYAETEVSFDGQVRVRGEGERKSFDDNEQHIQTKTWMRTRFGISALVDGNAQAYIQFQDSRVLGANNQSGSLSSFENVDLHQAYLKVNRVFADGLGFQAGRFEVNFGNQRVFGAVGWSNVGRSWEGGLGWYDQEKYTFTFYNLKALEVDDEGYNADFDVAGVFLKLKNINLDLFAFAELNADTSGLQEDIKKLKRYNLGLYYNRVHEQFDFTLTGNLQFGTQADDTGYTENDISAKMFAFEAGMSLEGERNVRLAAGIDYSSGDDGTDTDVNTYQNSYYTGHKFRGYMDYFVGSEDEGLVDMMFRAQLDVTDGWRLAGDLHYFQTAVDYVDPIDGGDTKDVGMEIDLTLKTKKIKGVDMMWGFSYFIPKEAFADDTDAQKGLWFFHQTAINF